jgi:hypothetical protein
MTEPGRTRWTDERIDDLAVELREFRAEMRDFRREVREEMRDFRGELYSTRRWTVNLWATTVLGFVAVLIQTSLR